MVRRVGLKRQGVGMVHEVLVGCARCRLRPKLMNCCRPEENGTKEHGHMLTRILKLEEGEVPDRSMAHNRVVAYRKKQLEDKGAMFVLTDTPHTSLISCTEHVFHDV